MNLPFKSLPLFLEQIIRSGFRSSLSAVAELYCSSASVQASSSHFWQERLLQFPLLLVLFVCLQLCVTGVVQVGRRAPHKQSGRQEGCIACRKAGKAEA